MIAHPVFIGVHKIIPGKRMPKQFHTFLSDHNNLHNNVFYSGTLNPLIKDMLMQNVKNLFTLKNENPEASKRVCSISSECLDTLSNISRQEKKGHPVLFNLLRSVGSCQLNLGVTISKSEAPGLKKALDELKRQPTQETKRKFFEQLRSIKSDDDRLASFLPLMSLALGNKRNFTFYFDSFSEADLFLTIKFEVEESDE